jgi:hypothetical protein
MANWTAPRIWDGGECWIIGGGPSILEQFEVPSDLARMLKTRDVPLSELSPYMAAIHDKHVIGVNLAYQIGDWIDVIFFGDCSWYLWHRKQLAKVNALKVSCCPRFAQKPEDDPERIKFLHKDKEYRQGITKKRDRVAWNNNSGAAAINVARHFGVKRIVLLGFDMCLDEKGTSHYHGCHYEKISGPKDPKGNPKKLPKRKKLPFSRHLKGFPKIAADAKHMGIEIVNASPNSTIDVFPKIPVKELI